MSLLNKFLGLLGTAIVVSCVATVAVQATGLCLAWSRGVLTPDKVARYAGVIYGLDPLELTPPPRGRPPPPKPATREEILADRVRKTPHLAERTAMIDRSTAELRGITLTLKRSREKYEDARDGFEALLDDLESGIESQALRELRVTLEIVSPKQAKEILRSMATGPMNEPADQAIHDVVKIIQPMADDKLRKILAEFKSDEEQKLLHRILVDVGQLKDRTALTGGPPFRGAEP